MSNLKDAANDLMDVAKQKHSAALLPAGHDASAENLKKVRARKNAAWVDGTRDEKNAQAAFAVGGVVVRNEAGH